MTQDRGCDPSMHGKDRMSFGGNAVLQGTFETLPLQELLTLLARSRKTGALWLEAGPATAAIYIDDGRCCAAQSGELMTPVNDAPSLLVRLVELCFAAARTEDGSFRFGNEQPPWTSADSVDLEVAIDELGRLLDEWRDIQNVIPSLDCRVKLSDELGSDGIVIDRERWGLIVAIDGRRTVRELVRKTNRAVLDVCHTVVALVDAGAVTVGAPAVEAARTVGRAGKAPSLRSLGPVEPETPWGPGVESPHPGPAFPDADEEHAAVAEKGSLMRAFSGLGE
jgi:hypothetical protein